MKLTIDENIVFAKEAFSEFGEIELLNGRDIKPENLYDTDILIVRSVTNVNSKLLSKSKVKFVGTATIGTDHVDVDYLNKNGIAFFSAAGCNAMSVAEYVFSAISFLAYQHQFALRNKTIGIIGVGNVGSKVKTIAESLGMEVIQNDPPLEKIKSYEKYFKLEDALSADIVTFHVPLNKSGIYKTFHLLDKHNIGLIKPSSILINTSRGAVVNNAILKRRLLAQKDIFVVLDVWENEPFIDHELFSIADIGTPHIAGYSFDGKANGTKIIYDYLCEFLGREKRWKPELPKQTNKLYWQLKNSVENNLYELFTKVYPIWIDDMNFRKGLSGKQNSIPELFDKLRKNYKKRFEFSNYEIDGNNLGVDIIKLLKALKVKIC